MVDIASTFHRKGVWHIRCPERVDQYPCPKHYTTLKAVVKHVAAVHNIQLHFLTIADG